ncbi:MAG: hypothetical protein WBA91_05625 [Paracoccaceae bacterium]
MRFVISVIALLLFSLPLQARPLTGAESASLEKSVESYLRATMAGNAEKIVASLPPRLLNVFAGTAGIEAKQVEKALIEQTRTVLRKGRVKDFVAAPGPYDGNDARMADGTPIVWVIVRTQFVTEATGQRVRNDQPLFGVLEDGKWYFSRIDGPQQQQVVSFAYPFMAGLELPPATATPLQ